MAREAVHSAADPAADLAESQLLHGLGCCLRGGRCTTRGFDTLAAAPPPASRHAGVARAAAKRRSRCHVGLCCCLGGGSRRLRSILVEAPPPRSGLAAGFLFDTCGGAYQNVVAPFPRWGAGESTSLGQLRGWREDSSHSGSSNLSCIKWPLPPPGKPFTQLDAAQAAEPPCEPHPAPESPGTRADSSPAYGPRIDLGGNPRQAVGSRTSGRRNPTMSSRVGGATMA